MGKKRKATSQRYNDAEKPGYERKSTLRINTYEDVADSEDEFLDNRDRILLDERRDAKKRRKVQEEDALLEASDEEVLGVPELDEEDYDDEEDEEMQELGEGDEDDDEDGDDSDVQERLGSRRGVHAKSKDVEEDEEEGWGDAKADYYGADAIDTEQAALDEAAEAQRLQQRQLEAMAGADMLYDDDEDEAAEDHEVGEAEDIITERLPDLEVPEDLTPEERLELLRTRYPELEAIAMDWVALHELREEAEKDAARVPDILKAQATLGIQRMQAQSHIATMRFNALSAYLAACAMYFAVLTSTAANGKSGGLALPPKKLREHPVIQNMLESRQLWSDVSRHPRVDTAAELAQLQKEVRKADKAARKAARAPKQEIIVKRPDVKKQAKKSKSDRAAEKATAQSEARRAERARRIEEELADLSALASQPTKKPSNKRKTSTTDKLNIAEEEDDSDLGDEAALTASDLAAKAARKKSLKFYTSQIAQRSNKVGARSREYGGDVDVPHRERLRDREARLNAAAEKRGRAPIGKGEELGGSSDEDDEAPALSKTQTKQSRKEDADASDSEDYYDMVSSKSKQKKADKRAAADAYAEAARQNARVYEVETVGEDGKRKISYQIEKNKGLTPFRKKEVRNPRVKKKLKYQEKLKKLGSTKQVYKGGEGKGGYGGELTGIKTGLVKSVRL